MFQRISKRLGWLCLTVIASCLSTIGSATPTHAAEKVSLLYGSLEFSISIASLDVFARTGKVDSELRFFARRATPEELSQLRRTLLEPAGLSTVGISQLLYSSFGETVLQNLGTVIQADGFQNGSYALRAAMILAAADPEGLTLLNALKKFPSRTVRINSIVALQLVSSVTTLLDQTRQAMFWSEQQSKQASAKESNPSPIPWRQLQISGRYSWTKETRTFHDRVRNRSLIVDWYQPKTEKMIPLLIISHGLAAGQSDFIDLAHHLASHGFVIAVVNHPGRDRQQFRNLLAGKAQEVMNPNEFIDRPLDIQFLLNQLAQTSRQIDLKRVGMIGHSFGGYTALALAGAPLNLDDIEQRCQSNQSNPSSIQVGNLSLLLQCQANKLPRTENRSLRDDRIQMVVALNPVVSHLLSKNSLAQVKIPILMMGGSDDLIAPVLLEQICPFSQIGSPNKYLAIVEKGTHFFAEAEPLAEGLSLPQTSSGANLQLKSKYINALSLVFAEGFVSNHPDYRRYLTSASVKGMSQSRLPLQFLEAFDQAQLPISVQKACSTP